MVRKKTTGTRKTTFFRSDITDKAQEKVDNHGFSGTYIRAVGTGHAETEWVAMGILSLADSYGGIVGVTLEGLTKDKVASSIARHSAGRILYEILQEPWNYKVSTEQGITLPVFEDSYAAVDTLVRRIGGRGKMIVQKADKNPNKKAKKVAKNIYIELQPKFVEKVGSIPLHHGDFHMDTYREWAQHPRSDRLPGPGLAARVVQALFG